MPGTNRSDDESSMEPQRRSPLSFPDMSGDRPKKWMKTYRTEIAASSSSVLSTLVAFPLDSVKSRMQTYKFNSVADCVTHTYRTEGIKGFTRGSAAPMASITMVRTMAFSIYQKCKYTYSAWFEKITGLAPLVIVNTPGSYPTFSTVACFGAAGATSGALVTTVSCPFEFTKLSAQISELMANSKTSPDEVIRRSYQSMGPLRTARNIIKHRGVFGLYSGFKLHLMRDTLGTAIYFMTYESIKQVSVTKTNANSPTSPLAVVIAGGLCGLVSWACIYPIDSAKSIYQRNCLTHGRDKEVKQPKIQFFNKRMYRGLGVSMARSCVLNATFFSSFELIKKHINSIED
ncbi:MAG: hypothetical protein M1825_005033 [Sarcosagium campestre]|nr:MAG: hypothetical protein M1825_005033 [Sarcosagium campestre]